MSNFTVNGKRYLEDLILEDLKLKMVMLSGPRQVGKTTLARRLVSDAAYFNWDIPQHRERILKQQWPLGESIWVLDEIHKYNKWRNMLKGLFDEFHGKSEILVTGSARLDYYRRGGDSLQGRYFFYRMHPITYPEALHMQGAESDIQSMLLTGGFPEPFFSGKESYHKRWARQYRSRLIQEDLVSLESVKDLGSVELLSILLTQRVGLPLSAAALARDVQVSPKTIQNWIAILERLYSIFLIPSFRDKSLRSVRKEKKHYFMDWAVVEDMPSRAENFIASHLLKYSHFKQDTEGEDLELFYFRDSDGREVDFILADKNKPVMAVEVKWQQTDISKNLIYFKRKFPETEAVQVYFSGSKEYITTDGIQTMGAERFLARFV
jgi:uncharacterized protein